MTECECLVACPFFNDQMSDMPALADSMKDRYCLTDNSDCARYAISSELGRKYVPEDLYPHEIDRVPGVVRAACAKS